MNENLDLERAYRISRYIYSASAKLSEKRQKAIKELLDKYPFTFANLLAKALEIEK